MIELTNESALIQGTCDKTLPEPILILICDTIKHPAGPQWVKQLHSIAIITPFWCARHDQSEDNLAPPQKKKKNK